MKTLLLAVLVLAAMSCCSEIHDIRCDYAAAHHMVSHNASGSTCGDGK